MSCYGRCVMCDVAVPCLICERVVLLVIHLLAQVQW